MNLNTCLCLARTVKTHNPIMVDSLHAGLKLGSKHIKLFKKIKQELN